MVYLMTFSYTWWPSAAPDDLQLHLITFSRTWWPSVLHDKLPPYLMTFSPTWWPSELPDVLQPYLMTFSPTWWPSPLPDDLLLFLQCEWQLHQLAVEHCTERSDTLLYIPEHYKVNTVGTCELDDQVCHRLKTDYYLICVCGESALSGIIRSRSTKANIIHTNRFCQF